ncbi:MAG: hypothetical protein J1E03_07410 [Acetatifactor sp.]|nr:hypothetical protein [Acetatifactor sp.]
MSFFDKYTPLISKLIIGGEELLNLCELISCIEMDKSPQLIDGCIIMPFYVSKGSRYELYQYEFYIESQNGESFQEYILRVTGRKNIESVPADILEIRQRCFVKIEEGNQCDILSKIKEFFSFLMKDEKIQKEIMDVFSEYDVNKLFVCIY